jgi:hypothetical protein
MFQKLFFAFTFAAIFTSGVNQETIFLSILLSAVATSLGLVHIVKERIKLMLPRHLVPMILFTLVLHSYLIFVGNRTNPLLFALIFTEGILYWLIFFNIGGGGTFLKSMLIKLTLLYSFFYLLTNIFNLGLTKLSTMFFLEIGPSRHYHMGDLWVFAIIGVAGGGWNKLKPNHWLFIGLGVLFLVLSNSRSAYLALLVAVIYLVAKTNSVKAVKKTFVVLLVVLITTLFILAGFTKTSLFSRPYFLQSIQAFPSHILGVGMGNFGLIGEYLLKTTFAKEISISSHTHNIFLEALSGTGIFSILFLIFLIQVVKDLLNCSPKKAVWGALLTAILANFMLDTTYTIPGLVWILFICLGVFQASKSQPKET